MQDTTNPEATAGTKAPAIAFEPAPTVETGAASEGVEFEADAGLNADRQSASRRLKEEASRLGQQAAERARGFADQGKERATSALGEFSSMLRDAAQTVDDRLGGQYGGYARSAADSIESFAGTLESKQVDDLVDDAREFVRKSPAVAIGIAAALGFVVARIVKSSMDGAADADASDRTDV